MSFLPYLIEEEVDEIIRHLDQVFDKPPKTGKATVPSRQILIVHLASYYSGTHFEPSMAAPESQAYIHLAGAPSPHSEVTNGFIRFVPPHKLRKPHYKEKTINMWVDQAVMAQTLEQLRQAKRYFWIGFFENDYVYADIHSTA